MEKITLEKIIGAVRDLEIRKSKNDSQFEFYNKKKHRIERKERIMGTKITNTTNIFYFIFYQYDGTFSVILNPQSG